MGKITLLRSREQRLVFEVFNALGASLDLREVVSVAYPKLLSLVGADYAALAVTRMDHPDVYEWFDPHLPPGFLGSYPEMAPHDFVQSAVLGNLNTVMRDCQMIDRPSLEANMMYRRAREEGVPIEHVMAVMLHVGGWQSGLSLYRDRRRPFTEHDQFLLQAITTGLANAVRNCRQFGSISQRYELLDMHLLAEGGAFVIVQPPGRVIDQTDAATVLLERWFSPGERTGGGLPQPLLDALAQMVAERAHGPVAPRVMRKPGEQADLRVEIQQLPGCYDVSRWALFLRQVSHAPPVPAAWRELLTEREVEVVSKILQGSDNLQIAEELGCKVATVKKHAQNIFDKLGVDDRKMLMYRARRES